MGIGLKGVDVSSASMADCQGGNPVFPCFVRTTVLPILKRVKTGNGIGRKSKESSTISLITSKMRFLA